MKNSSDLNQILLNFVLILFFALFLVGVIILRSTPSNPVKPLPAQTTLAGTLQISASPAMPRALIPPCESLGAPYVGRKSPYDQQDVQVIMQGNKIYVENCAVCHGMEGRGDGIGAAILDIRPVDFTDPDIMRRMPVDCHFAIINEGVPGKSMPPWKQLGEDAIWKVLHYTRGFTAMP